ncbi:unnamed protein product, partial [Heterosigma akashiwo]
ACLFLFLVLVLVHQDVLLDTAHITMDDNLKNETKMEPEEPVKAPANNDELVKQGDGGATKEGGKVESGEEKVKPISPFKLFSKADCFEVLLMILGTIFAAGMGILLPIFLIVYGDTIDKLNSTGDFQKEINELALLFTFLGIAALVAGTLQVLCFTLAGERQAQRLKELYVKAILRQDIAWFEVNSPAELSSRVNMTTFEIQDGIARKLGDLLSFFVQFLACFAVAFYTNWKISLVLVAASFPAMGAAGTWMAAATAAADKQGHEQYARAGFLATEVIGGLRTVASLVGERREAARYADTLREAQRIGVRKKLAVGLSTGLTNGCELLTYALAFWYGIKLVADQLAAGTTGGVSGGDVVIAMWAVLMGGYAMGQMTPGATAFATARVAGARLFATLERTPPIDTYSEEGKKIQVKGAIELRSVDFTYPTRPDIQVCKGYSLVVNPGETVALVGPSGSGKSTFMSLLLRFYDPQGGQVLVDGEDVRGLHLRHFRRRSAFEAGAGALRGHHQGQHPARQARRHGRGSLRCRPQGQRRRLHRAFPMGYATEVGEGGAQLSGGQKQRVAIARALLPAPAVLLLDEATSALDNESERLVQKALDKVQAEGGRTVVVIAHRLSTVKRADRIAVVDGGRVVDQGTHAELLRPRWVRRAPCQRARGVPPPRARPTRGAGAERSLSVLVGRRRPAGERSEKRRVGRASQAEGAMFSGEGGGEGSEKWRRTRRPGRRLAKVTAGLLALHEAGLAHAGGASQRYPGRGTMPAPGGAFFYLQDPAEMRDEAAKYALVFCALGVAGFVGMTLLFYGIGSSGERMTTRLRNKTFVSILRHDAGWFDRPRHSTGNLVTHLADDCKKMQSAFGEQWGMQVQIFACLGVSITLGLFFSWRMGLVVIGTLPLNAMAGAMYMATMTGGNYKSGDDGKPSAAGALLSMAVNGMSTVTSLNLQLPLSEAYNALSEAAIGPRTRRAFTGGLAFAFSGTVLYCSFALMFWFAAVLINNGHNSFKEVMAAIMALIYAAFGLGQASTTAGDQKAALEAARKIFSVIESAEALEIDALSEEGLRPEAVAGKVEFRDLHFAYPTRPNNPVYSGYSLVAEPGQTVALVGPSGGGKSTAMALLLRFYSPDKGQVLLDGRDIRDLNLGWLRRQVGYVGQEPVLFAGTIRENIVYGEDPAAPFTDEQSAARDAFAHDFIAAQPAGYATDVGERSALLSGGQKQRVAIARALIRRPAVLLLDEATSALDNES